MRAVFFGSPEFAVPCLDALNEIADVVAVVSQPDRPKGRGMKLQAPAVKQRALELGLPVMQPQKVRTPDFAASIAALNADVALVVAYGRILPRAVLDATRRGCINVHASLLPRWRGAAPIQWAIASGDKMTGVCLMKLDEGMDTGPVLATMQTEIDPDETGSELSVRLSALGAELVRNAVPRFVRDELVAVPQPEAGATHARMLEKSDSVINWQRSAQQIHDQIRAMQPWPGAIATVDGAPIKIHRSRMFGGNSSAPGVVLGMRDDAIEIGCGQGTIGVLSLQQSGRRAMSADAFMAGNIVRAGSRFE
ncbi:MAG: methionyl-tRNA formyltransferase [Polyangiales bacterium]